MTPAQNSTPDETPVPGAREAKIASGPSVSLADHKKMVALGIKFRPADGKWGFKRKCANPKCENILKATCYCSDTLQEAFYDVTLRSLYSCSTRCGIVSGGDQLADAFNEWRPGDVADLVPGAKLSPRDYEAIQTALTNCDPDRVRGRRRQVMFAWVEEEWSNWDGDGDEGECSCEI